MTAVESADPRPLRALSSLEPARITVELGERPNALVTLESLLRFRLGTEERNWSQFQCGGKRVSSASDSPRVFLRRNQVRKTRIYAFRRIGYGDPIITIHKTSY